MRWDGVRQEQWLRLARANGAPPHVSGRLTGRAVLQGQGRSTADILATLSVRTRTELLDGSISHLVVETAGVDIEGSLGLLIAGELRRGGAERFQSLDLARAPAHARQFCQTRSLQ